MTGDIGTAADIATGGIIAHAVDPGVAGAARHGHGASACLNCGTKLIGEHCHACGQAGHVHRSLMAIAHEIGHGVFHFEGRIWRTLPMLLLHPGALTRRYVHGERTRFVSPLALFLFTVFLMFATISAVGGDIADKLPDVAQRRADVARIDARIEGAKATIVLAEAARGRAAASVDDTELTRLKRSVTALQRQREELGGDGFVFTNIKTGWKGLDKGVAKANANPGLMIYKLQTSAYKYSWGLIPLSIPFVALLFLWRRGFALYDHAIFVTYSIAFMMLLVIAAMLAALAGVPGGLITVTMLLAPPAHMFAQLRGAYGLRKRSAAWRTVALIVFSSTTLIAFIVLLLLHGLSE